MHRRKCLDLLWSIMFTLLRFGAALFAYKLLGPDGHVLVEFVLECLSEFGLEYLSEFRLEYLSEFVPECLQVTHKVKSLTTRAKTPPERRTTRPRLPSYTLRRRHSRRRFRK